MEPRLPIDPFKSIHTSLKSSLYQFFQFFKFEWENVVVESLNSILMQGTFIFSGSLLKDIVHG